MQAHVSYWTYTWQVVADGLDDNNGQKSESKALNPPNKRRSGSWAPRRTRISAQDATREFRYRRELTGNVPIMRVNPESLFQEIRSSLTVNKIVYTNNLFHLVQMTVASLF